MKLVFEYHDKEKKQIYKRAIINEDGKYIGPYEEYYENGQLSIKATYADPKQIDPSIGEITDNNGRFIGDYISYFENGKIKEKKHFDGNGQLDGYYERHWHEFGGCGTTRGWRSEYATYNHGKLDGDYEFYLEREARYESFYKDKDRDSLHHKTTYKNGETHGNYEGFLPMINKDIEKMMFVYNPYGFWTRCSFENGLYHGDFVSFELDGTIQEQCTMAHGKINGLYTAIKHGIYGRYENGVPVGEHVFGYSYGKPLRKMNYNKNGVLDGVYIKYSFNSEQVEEEFYYQNGVRNGPYRSFKNNQLIEEGVYKNDLRDGIWIQYNKDGKIEKFEKYNQGELVEDLTQSAKENEKIEEKNKILWEEQRFAQEASRFVSKHHVRGEIENSHQHE